MKMKMLATSIAVSMPLLLGAAHAQTTATQGNDSRPADGGAMTPNQSTAPATGTQAPAPATGTQTPAPATGTPAPSGPASTPAPAAPTADAAATTEAITGWSAKDDFIGKSVFNEADEKIGDVNDIVIASDGRSMFVLVGAGGFLGMGEKSVAVPFDRIQRMDDRILLSGYTKEQLKALPEVRKNKR